MATKTMGYMENYCLSARCVSTKKKKKITQNENNNKMKSMLVLLMATNIALSAWFTAEILLLYCACDFYFSIGKLCIEKTGNPTKSENENVYKVSNKLVVNAISIKQTSTNIEHLMRDSHLHNPKIIQIPSIQQQSI